MAAKKPILTVHEIEDRLEEAALTLKRLPAGSGPRGYGSSWSDIVRSRFTAYGFEQARIRVIPIAREIQRMEEAIDWLRLIGDPKDEPRAADDRRIVWMRAELAPWRAVCARVGLSRSQAHRRWAAALITLQRRLARRKPASSTRKGGAAPAPPVNREGGNPEGVNTKSAASPQSDGERRHDAGS